MMSSEKEASQQLKESDNALERKVTVEDAPADAKADGSGENDYYVVDDKKNPHVYVSGLPLDTDEEEFYSFMKKCGVIAEDDEGNHKLQLYRNADGSLKGDGRCTYLRVESVSLALTILDESDYRDGNIVHIERAKFKKTKKPKKKTQHAEDDADDDDQPKKKKKKSLSKQKLGWHDTDTKRKKALGVLILKHMFNPSEFNNDPLLVDEIKEDILKECKKFGIVKKIDVFDRNPEGVVLIKYADDAALGPAIATFNGRWFGGQKVVAEEWDGRTKYKVEESEEERERRLKQWDEYLQGNQ